jgi:predicted HTH transcriptional regulator
VAAADELAARVRAWAAGGERFEVEFKSEARGALSDRELIEAAVCLANGSGGVLLIGVEDDGSVTGARPRHESGRTDPLRLQALVAVGLAELQVLTELTQERRATTGELASLVQRTGAETRQILMRMVERGWVEARGDGKGRSWHLSAALYRTLQAPAGHVRIRGFEPSQQETMVLQYVRAHGRVSRAEAAELCAITPDQASRLLRRMLRDGRLTRQGDRRGTYYMIN